MSESEAAKVAGRLQKDVWTTQLDRALDLLQDLRGRTGEPSMAAGADAEQEIAELRRELGAAQGLAADALAQRDKLQKLVDKTALAAADRTLQAEHSGELGRVQELERQLAAAQRQTEAEVEHGNDLARQLNKVEGEIAELAQQFANAIDILKDAYVAREVPWTDVAAGMMTIARDGTPWMVEAYDELGTWTLRNGAKRFEKEPMNGETVRVLVPYVTPEQAEALVVSELGGRA